MKITFKITARVFVIGLITAIFALLIGSICKIWVGGEFWQNIIKTSVVLFVFCLFGWGFSVLGISNEED